MRGDESYAGSRSYYVFRDVVADLFGHKHIIPAHQGRAAERLLSMAVLEPHTSFPATRTSTRPAPTSSGRAPRRSICRSRRPRTDPHLHPFKGNIDLERLEASSAEPDPSACRSSSSR